MLLGGPKFDDDAAGIFAAIEAERKADSQLAGVEVLNPFAAS